MELKTLKDIKCKRFDSCTESPLECKNCETRQFYEDDLRQEAIKLIKKDAFKFRIPAFMDFFNIIEEDLK